MGISVQFHATPAENVAFCVEVLKSFDVFMYGLTLRPFVLHDAKKAPASDLLRYKRIVFSTYPVINSHESESFHHSNSDVLMLEIGSLTPEGLKESWLTSKASGDAEKMWRKTAKLLKDRTGAGAYAVNPETGARVFVRNHRFSQGARELAASGIAMLPVAGSAVYEFDGKSL